MHFSKKIFVALAAAGIVAAGGSAFTAGITVPDSVAGYGTSTVSGPAPTGVKHNLSADGKTITSTVISFGVDQTGREVTAGFGTADLESCIVGGGGLTATCTWGTPYDTEDATDFNVAVS